MTTSVGYASSSCGRALRVGRERNGGVGSYPLAVGNRPDIEDVRSNQVFYM